MKDTIDYIQEITFFRLYPTFENYWNYYENSTSFKDDLKLIYKNNEDELKKRTKEDYVWRTELAKTALINGWKDVEQTNKTTSQIISLKESRFAFDIFNTLNEIPANTEEAIAKIRDTFDKAEDWTDGQISNILEHCAECTRNDIVENTYETIDNMNTV